MSKEKFKVGDIVHSKINTFSTYKVVKTNKTTCWLRVNGSPDLLYKGIRYHIIKKYYGF